MANFSAADVKRLRDMTAAGMLDCKKALEETDGDFDKAVELLRIKGAKDIGKRAERATFQGLIASKDGALIELNAETDFVAKNDKFIDLANKIIDLAAAERRRLSKISSLLTSMATLLRTLSRTCLLSSARRCSCVATPVSTARSLPTCTSAPQTCLRRLV